MARPKQLNPAEIRSKRTSLILPEKEFDGITALAQIRGQSVNDLLVGIISVLVDTNAAAIADFVAARDKAAAVVTLRVDST